MDKYQKKTMPALPSAIVKEALIAPVSPNEVELNLSIVAHIPPNSRRPLRPTDVSRAVRSSLREIPIFKDRYAVSTQRANLCSGHMGEDPRLGRDECDFLDASDFGFNLTRNKKGDINIKKVKKKKKKNHMLARYIHQWRPGTGEFANKDVVVSCTVLMAGGETARAVMVCSADDKPDKDKAGAMATRRAIRCAIGRDSDKRVEDPRAIEMMIQSGCPFTMHAERYPDLSFQEVSALMNFRVSKRVMLKATNPEYSAVLAATFMRENWKPAMPNDPRIRFSHPSVLFGKETPEPTKKAPIEEPPELEPVVYPPAKKPRKKKAPAKRRPTTKRKAAKK